MCCCGKPTINGTLGYRWNQPDAPPSIYPVNPPTLKEDDTLLYDEPGRCGGIDAHCHHYRLVRGGTLLVRHGGGEERIQLSTTPALLIALAAMDSHTRYWLFRALYYAHHYAATNATDRENARWAQAVLDRRVRTKRTKYTARVWINPKEAIAQ